MGVILNNSYQGLPFVRPTPQAMRKLLLTNSLQGILSSRDGLIIIIAILIPIVIAIVVVIITNTIIITILIGLGRADGPARL